jgi:hypothetical protein
MSARSKIRNIFFDKYWCLRDGWAIALMVGTPVVIAGLCVVVLGLIISAWG